ncbi:EF hand [Rubripirellula tenax]|uniref:EF hand n=1 Tax=Rubripirellula tenax TaxID=2528015 RepID=A0A5C6EK28_9BACT|nr:proprotein convertase P-domain-containing protein [Rubripirellula tenax]TWU48860.1 EF hand [Rubripirellula tenax]
MSRTIHSGSRRRASQLVVASIATIACITACDSASAQSGLRESLERLDRNQNGQIDPKEITPLARPYLERIAEARRLSLDRPNDISKLQEAARIYYALVNGVAGKNIEPDLESSVKGFGPIKGQPLVPEFGLSDFEFPYTQEDLDETDLTLRRYDRNQDGYIDRAEAQRGKWTHRDPFEEDYNYDGRLSRLELTQRYARRRLLDGASDELVQRAKRIGSGVRPSRDESDDDRNDSRWWRNGGTSYYLTASMMSRFDLNRNGCLEANESARLGFPTSRIDVDRDGELSRDEMHSYLSELQENAGDESIGVPSWFYERDENRDDQVTMAEYTDEWSDESVQSFVGLDINDDGILTLAEVTQSAALTGGSFTNQTAEVLPPRKTVISEIVIDEKFMIGDLDVQLSITHSHLSYLDGYLISPNGTRVELFTGVGGGDDHFNQTIFDDQSQIPITKARAPFEGNFIPEAVMKRQPGLSQFNGTEATGTWQLVIAGARNERFGMLHQWSLMIQPQDSLTPMTDATQSQITQTASTTDPDAREDFTSQESPTGELRDSVDSMEKIRQKRAEMVEKFRLMMESKNENDSRERFDLNDSAKSLDKKIRKLESKLE